ncbi:MAG: hypothetical protein H6839_06290 [Planctomycetes bacterium]|nr:hypothetical protein [Planctomycetota bacterium]
MNFWEKLAIVRQEYERAGARKMEIAPPAYGLVWLLRIPVRPPATASFLQNVLVFGLVFEVVFLASIAALGLAFFHEDLDLFGQRVLPFLAIGPVMGVLLAVQFMHIRIKRKLPTWEEIELDGKFDPPTAAKSHTEAQAQETKT